MKSLVGKSGLVGYADNILNSIGKSLKLVELGKIILGPTLTHYYPAKDNYLNIAVWLSLLKFQEFGNVRGNDGALKF